MSLRPYQEKAINSIREEFAKGIRKVLLHLSTGAGKTVIFCQILKALEKKGNRGMMVVRGRKLVSQASDRLLRESIHHGVLMAGHWNYKPHAPIQAASIDTLRSRGLKPDVKLIVVDEAHLFTSKNDRGFFEQYPDAFILSVTATPFPSKPLDHIAETVVHPVTMQELISQGFLVKARNFAPYIPDLHDIKTKQGEYVQDDLDKRLNKSDLIGDIVTNWINLAENRSTLVFAVNVSHSKNIVEQFNARGIAAIHIDANNTDRERLNAEEKLKNGEIKILSNVGIYCTGADFPFLGCVVLARPTKSYNLYIQQAGRGTRICPELHKTDFILLDHGSNILRHGFIDAERDAQIMPKKKNKNESIKAPKICKTCYLVFAGPHCPQCGVDITSTNARKFMIIEGDLKEITDEPIESKIERFIQELKVIKSEKGYKHGWMVYRVIDKFGIEVAESYFPRSRVIKRIEEDKRLEAWRGRGLLNIS